MKLLNKYFKIVRKIYNYFDYSGGKKIYPFEDYTEFDWYKKDNRVFYSLDGSDFFSDEYIEEYVGEDGLYTMFLIKDSLNIDDCLIIFDNKKLVDNDYRD